MLKEENIWVNFFKGLFLLILSIGLFLLSPYFVLFIIYAKLPILWPIYFIIAAILFIYWLAKTIFYWVKYLSKENFISSENNNSNNKENWKVIIFIIIIAIILIIYLIPKIYTFVYEYLKI